MFSPHLTLDQSNSIADGRRLFHLGQLPAAIRLAKTAMATSSLAAQAQLLLARCLVDQGRFREAGVVYKTALSELPSDNEMAQEMCLRSTFLQVFLARDPIAFKKAQAQFVEIQSQTDEPCLKALAQALRGRIVAIAVEWKMAPPADLVGAQQWITAAVEDYQQANDTSGALESMLQLGRLHLMGPTPDRTAARTIFEQVQAQALAENNLILQAEATLRLAELDFDAGLILRAAEQEIQRQQPLYQQALTLYETADHALGPAHVLLSMGSSLINAGFDGRDRVHQAVHLYRQEENLIGLSQALSKLGTWHLKQGAWAQALGCYQQAAEVAQEMDFPLAQATAHLGIADHFFRVGDYARALAGYEKAKDLVALPGMQSLVGLALTNTYTKMNLPHRAEAVCRDAIVALMPSSPSDHLSQAYFLLGNVLTSMGNWRDAITVWRDGIAVDEALHNQRGQAEKLQCTAQATVMQHHRPGGPPIPEAAYQEAMALYAQAIDLLREIGDPEAEAAIAGTYQLQGQTAITCGYSLDALHYLEQARKTYDALDLTMQAAMTNSLLGLVCHHLGGQGYPDLYIEAAHCQEQALNYFRRTGMRDIAWQVCFYLAHIAFRRGLLALSDDEQHEYWLDAAHWLEDASVDIEFVRARFVEIDPVTSQSARLGLVADKEKVYVFAVQLHLWYLRDTRSAFNWLERLKGRSFLDALALTPLPSSAITNKQLIDRERHLLIALQQVTTQAEVVSLSEALHTLWDQMAADTTAAEYVALRRGEPVSWEEVCSFFVKSSEMYG